MLSKTKSIKKTVFFSFYRIMIIFVAGLSVVKQNQQNIAPHLCIIYRLYAHVHCALLYVLIKEKNKYIHEKLRVRCPYSSQISFLFIICGYTFYFIFFFLISVSPQITLYIANMCVFWVTYMHLKKKSKLVLFHCLCLFFFSYVFWRYDKS